MERADSLRSCPRRDLVGSTAAERQPLGRSKLPMRFWFASAILALLGSPAALHACTCFVKVPQERLAQAQAEASRSWTERPHIFIGHALEVDETPTQPTRETVRFVTERSWRGAMPDTVTLLVGSDASCAHYFAGLRYLVVADRAVRPGAPLRTAPCDNSWNVTAPGAQAMLAKLGSPNWTAPPVGQRTLDSKAVRLGDPRGRLSAGDSLAYGLPVHEAIARFEISDWVGQPTRPSSIIYLKAGLYQFRITWSNGTSYSSYLSLRCERPIDGGPCAVFRSLFLLR